MGFVKVVLLICATSLPRAECQPESALDVILGPETTSLSFCGFQAQAFLARMAFSEKLHEGTYLKIQCTLGHRTATATPRLRE